MIWWKKIKGKLVQPFSYFLPKSQQFSLYIQQFPQFPTVQHYFPIVTSFTIPNNSLSFQLSNITSQQLLALQFPTIPNISIIQFLIYSNLLVSDMLTIPKVSDILFTIPNVFDILINPKVSNIKIPNSSWFINNSKQFPTY